MAPEDDQAWDRVDELMLEVLARPEVEWPEAIEALACTHAVDADRIRSRFAILQSLDLGVAKGTPREFPERLGEYLLVERLGSGGMGVVYRAVQETMGRDVALKLVRPEHLYFPGTRERFRREVESIARLCHPNVVLVHTVGESAGVPFYAMEYVRGRSLDRVIQACLGKRPERLTGLDLWKAVAGPSEDAPLGEAPALFAGSWYEVCLRIGARLAEGLEHAHSRGVLHRDVKPSNVMVTPEGRVVLLDFGLALAQGSSRMTRSHAQLGSLAYMAPEQVRGAQDRIDERSDVWGLGVTIYELLTLVSPHLRTTIEATRASILQGTVASPRELCPACPADASVVLLTALAPEPERRYQRALDLGRDFENVLARRPVLAKPSGACYRAWRWVRRNPAGAVALLLAFGLAIGVPTAVSVLLARERDSAVVAEAKAARLAYSANLAAAQASLLANDAGEARRRLDLCAADRRGIEWKHLDLACDGSLAKLEEHENGVRAVAISPSGQLLASGDGAGNVLVRDFASRRVLARVRHGVPVERVQFTSEHTLLIADRDARSVLHDATSGAWIAESPRGIYRVFPVQSAGSKVWCNEGGWRFSELAPETLLPIRTIAIEPVVAAPEAFVVANDRLVALGENEILVWETSAGRLVHRIPAPVGPGALLAIDPSGARLAIASGTRVVLSELGVAKAIESFDLGSATPTAIAFTASGSHLLIAGSDLALRAHDLQVGRTSLTMHGHSAKITALASATTDLPYAVSASLDGTVRIWSVVAARERSLIRRHLGVIKDVVAIRGGDRLATISEDGYGWVWDPMTVWPLFVLQEHMHHVLAIAESPDRKTLVTCFHNKLLFRDAESGAIRTRVDTLRGVVLRLAWSPDSAHLACGDVDGEVSIRNSTGETELSRFKIASAPITGLAFAPDGETLFVAARDGTLGRFRTADGDPVWRSTERAPLCHGLRLLRSGDRIATIHGSEPGLLCLWNARSGTRLESATTRAPLRSLAVSGDESRLLTGGNDGMLTFWEPTTLEPLLGISVQSAPITAIACDPAGRWFGVGSTDCECRILRTVPPSADSNLAQSALAVQERLLAEYGSIREAKQRVPMSSASDRVRERVTDLLEQQGRVQSFWFDATRALQSCRQPAPTEEQVRQGERFASCLEGLPLGSAMNALLACHRKDHSRALAIARELLAIEGDSFDWLRADLLRIVVASQDGLGDRSGANATLQQLRTLCRQAAYAMDPTALAALAQAERLLR